MKKILVVVSSLFLASCSYEADPELRRLNSFMEFCSSPISVETGEVTINSVTGGTIPKVQIMHPSVEQKTKCMNDLVNNYNIKNSLER